MNEVQLGERTPYNTYASLAEGTKGQTMARKITNTKITAGVFIIGALGVGAVIAYCLATYHPIPHNITVASCCTPVVVAVAAGFFCYRQIKPFYEELTPEQFEELIEQVKTDIEKLETKLEDLRRILSLCSETKKMENNLKDVSDTDDSTQLKEQIKSVSQELSSMKEGLKAVLETRPKYFSILDKASDDLSEKIKKLAELPDESTFDEQFQKIKKEIDESSCTNNEKQVLTLHLSQILMKKPKYFSRQVEILKEEIREGNNALNDVEFEQKIRLIREKIPTQGFDCTQKEDINKVIQLAELTRKTIDDSVQAKFEGEIKEVSLTRDQKTNNKVTDFKNTIWYWNDGLNDEEFDNNVKSINETMKVLVFTVEEQVEIINYLNTVIFSRLESQIVQNNDRLTNEKFTNKMERLKGRIKESGLTIYEKSSLNQILSQTMSENLSRMRNETS